MSMTDKEWEFVQTIAGAVVDVIDEVRRIIREEGSWTNIDSLYEAERRIENALSIVTKQRETEGLK